MTERDRMQWEGMGWDVGRMEREGGWMDGWMAFGMV